MNEPQITASQIVEQLDTIIQKLDTLLQLVENTTQQRDVNDEETVAVPAFNEYGHLDFMLAFEGRSEEEEEMQAIIEGWADEIVGFVPPAPVGEAVHNWCCTAVGKALKEAGYKYLSTLVAREYKEYPGEKLDAPEKGCLLVYNKHICVCTGVRDDGTVEIVGGNQGDRMSKTTSDWYDAHMEFLGFFKPEFAGLTGPVGEVRAPGTNA